MAKIGSTNFEKRKFIEDLKLGKHGESQFMDVLDKCGFKYWPNVNDLETLDVFFFYKDFKGTAEVKYDIKQSETGNLAIEFYNPKSCKNSGVSASNADFWVYVLQDKSVWITSLSKLVSYMDDFPCLRTITNAGDGNASIKLYNSEVILNKVFTRIDKVKDGAELCSIFRQLAQ